MKYRKKPVVVEAIIFLGFDNLSNFSESPDWLLKAIYDDKKIKFFDEPNLLTIETLGGVMRAEVGDYIIKGTQGELYPCKPDVFEKTYEKVKIKDTLETKDCWLTPDDV